MLLLLFLHLAYLVHLLTCPYCSKEARQAEAGRGNFSFAVVMNISYKHLQLSACSVSSLLCFLSCSLITFLALLLVCLILLILKMVDTTQWANNKFTETASSIRPDPISKRKSEKHQSFKSLDSIPQRDWHIKIKFHHQPKFLLWTETCVY